MRGLFRPWDLSAKISFILVAVIVPTFVVMTVAQNQLTQPILEEDLRQMALHLGNGVVAEIEGGQLLKAPLAKQAQIETLLQEKAYAQPEVLRMDVLIRDPGASASAGGVRLLASSNDDDVGGSGGVAVGSDPLVMTESVVSDYKKDESGEGLWAILLPINEHKAAVVAATAKLKLAPASRGGAAIGTLRLLVSTRVVRQITKSLWKTTALASISSVLGLIFALNYFLRKTLGNERLLRQAESQNLQLFQQLRSAERQLMTTEKLAAMGQLTASFAHEIGTPLTAVEGHLQLLEEEWAGKGAGVGSRFQIIQAQLKKIEDIVKSFLQSTAKPTSKKQLVDLNRLVEQTIAILQPRLDALGIQLQRDLERDLAPLRVAPVEIEQVLLNLFNNAMDSIEERLATKSKGKHWLAISTRMVQTSLQQQVEVQVADNGLGIRKSDLGKVFKPFFTTKKPGEGTGLGLAICQQVIQNYGGDLALESKEGSWTRVTFSLPYQQISPTGSA